MTSQETVGALIAKDIWLQYKTPDGFVDVQAIIDSLTPPESFRPVEFTGATDEEGWQQLGLFCFDNAASLVGITNLVCNISSNREGIDIEAASDLVTLSFPNLVETTEGAYLNIQACPALTTLDLSALVNATDLTINNNAILSVIELSALESITDGGIQLFTGTGPATLNLPSLTNVAGAFACSGFSLLVTVNIPLLATVGQGFSVNTNPLLTTIHAQAWLPTDGTSIDVTGNALLAASVNLILARAIASGMTSGSIDLSGGTNAAPTGQGITDKANLIIAGVSVTTN